jgi:hypothetical protein
MAPVPPALFKARGTTLRADEYLRGVNPVGTVHRGPLSAFGRQEISALRTEPSVAFSRTDRLEAIRPFSIEYFLPGEGNRAYAASHAREYLARHEAEGLDRFSRPAVSEPPEPRWKTFGRSGTHHDFARTQARGGHLPLKPDWPNKNESRWGAAERLHRPLDGGHDLVQYSSFARQRLSTHVNSPKPGVDIGAATTRAERGRQTLGRAHDERSAALGACSPGPQVPRDRDGFALGAIGRQIEAGRVTEPRAVAGSDRRVTAPTWAPAGVKGGDWTRPVRPDPSVPGPGAYHETFDFRRTRGERGNGDGLGRGSTGRRTRRGATGEAAFADERERRLASSFNPKDAGAYWGSSGRGTLPSLSSSSPRAVPPLGSPGGSPARTYPVSGREIRARTRSGRWTPQDEQRGRARRLLGRASPTP